MLAVNYSTMRNNLKCYCDRATDEEETIVITRKSDKNVVLLSLEKYNQILKAIRNANYITMIDESMAQFVSGKAQVHDLIEEENA